MTLPDTVELPAIYEAKGRYATKIGCHLTAAGKRSRSYHWLPKSQKVALSEAIKIAADWETNLPLYKKWVEENRTLLEKVAPEAEWRKVIWVKGPFAGWVEKFEEGRQKHEQEKKVRKQENTEAAERYWGRRDHEAISWLSKRRPELLAQLRATSGALLGRILTIEQARDEFVAYKEGKVGGHRNRGGVEKMTHNNLKNQLKAILGHLSLVGLSPSDNIFKLDGPTLESLFDHVYKRVSSGEIGEWTAAHYCGALKQLLEWANKQSDISYRLPDNADDILHIAAPKKSNDVKPYDPAIIKTILKRLVKKGDEKTALAVLLSLCTGAYQKDIANWGYERQDVGDKEPHDNLLADNGETFVWWRREKTKNHNSFFTLHILPAEVVKLLNKHVMPNDRAENPHMRLLLNDAGMPLYKVGTAGRSDCIARQYGRAKAEVEEAMREKIADADAAKNFKIDYPFEQLRKDVMNFVYQQTKSTDMTQKFAGQTSEERRKQERADEMKRQFSGGSKPGVLDHYLRDNFADLTAILKLWHEQLRKDGIFKAAGVGQAESAGQ